MKKYILFLPLIIFLTVSHASGASYVIHLDNGSQFRTPWYSEEGKEVKFYILGGFAGIGKKYVKKIEKSSLAADNAMLPERPQADASQVKTTPETAPPQAAKSPRGVNKEDQRFMGDFNLLKERFRGVGNMPTQDLYNFLKDLRNFRDKILANRLGHIYDRELLEITDMGNKIADVLKDRGQ